MKTINSLFFFYIFWLFSPTARGQNQSMPQAELITPWIGLVTVDGENRTRTLRVSGSKQGQAGTLELDAVYGWTDGNQTSVKAEITTETNRSRVLRITTQPGSKIVAEQGPDGIFIGTFTTTNGKIKGLTVQVLSESALAKLSEGPTINQPGTDVPASCAKFIGGWKGDWGFGKRWLWVTEINPQCATKYSYSPQTNEFKSAEIKEGIFAFPCGTSGGICSFEHHGDELWGRYSGSDGTNTTVFQKITPSRR